MKTTINRERARELGFPIPKDAGSLVEYDVTPSCERLDMDRALEAMRAAEIESAARAEQCGNLRARLYREQTGHEETRRTLQAQLDAEQAVRKQLEQELEAALAKLTEPPAKPEKPAEQPKPEDKPKPQQGRRAQG